MENNRFNIRPEAEKEIIDFVNSGGLMEWNFWFEKVRAADEVFGLAWANSRHLLQTDSPDLNLLNHIWRNNDYGSVGQGKISEKYLTDEKVLLARVSWEIERALLDGIQVSMVLQKVPDLKTSRGIMHALRYRALAVISRLEIPSFYHEQYFREFAAYLGEKLELSLHGAGLMHRLAEYLPENLRGDNAIRFTFPWILYEELVLSKKPGYKRWSDETTDTDEQPELKSQEQKNVSQKQQTSSPAEESQKERQYWWMSLPQDIIEKFAGIPLEKLTRGHRLNIPMEFAPNIRLKDKIYWPNPDGQIPQLTFTVILSRENDHQLMVDQVYSFALPSEKLIAETDFRYDEFINTYKNMSGFFQLDEKQYDAVVRVNSETDRKKRAEKSSVASRLHSDGETTDDKLNYRLYATAIAQIIKDERTKPPVNIAIVAPWGHGKTTLMEFLREEFEKREKWKPKIATGVKMTVKALHSGLKSMFGKVQEGKSVLENPLLQYPTVWFNPWKYQSSEQIWAGIGHALITQIIGKHEPAKQEEIWLRLRLRRIDQHEIRKDIHKRFLNSWLPYAIGFSFAVIIGLILFSINGFENWKGITGMSATFLGSVSVLISGIKKWNDKLKDHVEGKLADYIREPDYAAKLGVFHEINEDLKIVANELIDPLKPAIVFIDDLDRCTPKTVAEVFEAVNLMMTGELKDRCYFVIGMDAQMVAAALDTEYNSWAGRLPDQERRHGSVGWYFLDKFIQLPFFIPVMDPEKRQRYIGDLFADPLPAKSGATPEQMSPKIEAAVEQLVSDKGETIPQMIVEMQVSNPVQYQEVRQKVVAKAIEQSQDSAEINKTVANFAGYLDTSPRGMKRFANLLRFYDSQRIVRRMDKNLMQSEFPEFDVLARWLVINLRWPQMVRWIQWEREEVLLYTVDPELKADFIDRQLDKITDTDFENAFEEWTKILNGKKLDEKKHLLWLYDRDLFKVLWSDRKPEARLKKALECDVW